MPPASPKISIIMPSYNQGRYLEAAIQSVLSQDYPNKELILVDGGSTDESVEIIRRYQSKLAYSVSEPDRGQSHALNKALAHVTGDVVGWLNSDDIYLPGAFTRIVKALAQYPDAIFVYGHRLMIDKTGLVCGWAPRPPFNPASTGYIIASETTFWRKDLSENLRFNEDLRFTMDLDYLCRLYRMGPSIKLDDYIGAFRCHLESKSSTLLDVASVEGEKCWKEIFPEYPGGLSFHHSIHFAKQLFSMFMHPRIIAFPYLYRRFWLGLRGVS